MRGSGGGVVRGSGEEEWCEEECEEGQGFEEGCEERGP